MKFRVELEILNYACYEFSVILGVETELSFEILGVETEFSFEILGVESEIFMS